MKCGECGAEADEQARGWRALIGEEDDGTLMAAVFCPACGAREFGELPDHACRALKFR